MELTIKEQKRNQLLSREEIKAMSSNGITPKAEELRIKLAEKLNKANELVVIKSIKGKFGRKDFEIVAYCYDDGNALKKTEPKAKKNAPTEAKKEEAKEKAK